MYVLGFNEKLKEAIPGVHYIPLGSNQNIIRFLQASLHHSIRQKNLFDFIKTFQLIIKGERKKLQQNNLTSFIKKIKPDIIHVQWPSLLPWLFPYHDRKPFKIIISQRGSQINIRPFVDDVFLNILKNNYKHLDGIHSVSKAIEEKRKFFLTKESLKEKVIYTGLNISEFMFNAEPPKNKTLNIISIGRSHWVKGYDIALKCLKIIKQNNINFKYNIVGAYNDEELLFLINELDLVTEVSLLPKMIQEKVFTKIKEADFLLLPSVEEGIANVAVEAMALGTPVISTDCGGMQELIEHNKEGWIVPIRNPKAMAEAIINFTTLNENEIVAIKRKARKKVEDQHCEEKMISEMEDFYKKVIETNI